MGFNWDLLKEEKIPTTALRTREFEMDNVFEVAVAARTINLDLPKDHFVHAIDVRVELGVATGGSATWAASAAENIIKNLKIHADGGKVFKNYTWDECKEICVLNGEHFGYETGAADGTVAYNRIYFSDPKIRHVRPIPSWIFTSFKLEVEWNAATDVDSGDAITSAPATKLIITVYESEWTGQNIAGDWPVLVEVCSGKTTKSTNTGDQKFPQTRANVVYGYLVHADDDATDSDAIFDWFKLVARKPEGTMEIVSKRKFTAMKAMNKMSQKNVAHATGYGNISFPDGLQTKNFTSLDIVGTIDSAGTNAGLRVVERYSL